MKNVYYPVIVNFLPGQADSNFGLQKLHKVIQLFGSAPYSGRSASINPLCGRTELDRFYCPIRSLWTCYGCGLVTAVGVCSACDKYRRWSELNCCAQIVIDWLEHCSTHRLEDFYHKVDFSSDRLGAW